MEKLEKSYANTFAAYKITVELLTFQDGKVSFVEEMGNLLENIPGINVWTGVWSNLRAQL